ncbi:hypothetical protein Glove_199g11 [Diversispora epigaea]|uniref:Protein kinase domain-containing protein n=1 Tax=Diversispora epigaea TaxID=1348612 RepID=A0A397IPR1_9GLOM|nr:hypothetical protein Glove_199g11 [Diversispora epigaea]
MIFCKSQLKFRDKNSIAIYVIIKNPTENEYMMVMNYAGYDFHPGNIVSCYITDFGLCKPVSEKDSENIFGIIPFMAPKTLNANLKSVDDF